MFICVLFVLFCFVFPITAFCVILTRRRKGVFLACMNRREAVRCACAVSPIFAGYIFVRSNARWNDHYFSLFLLLLFIKWHVLHEIMKWSLYNPDRRGISRQEKKFHDISNRIEQNTVKLNKVILQAVNSWKTSFVLYFVHLMLYRRKKNRGRAMQSLGGGGGGGGNMCAKFSQDLSYLRSLIRV